jgi:tetratricopeptide (TPR) repeat protein
MLDQYVQAEPLAVEALDGGRRVYGEDNTNTLDMLNNLAQIYFGQGQHHKAEPLLRELLAKSRRTDGADSPRVVNTLSILGEGLMHLGRPADAEPLLRECLSTVEKIRPNTWHVDAARSLLGGALAGQKKYAEAEPLLLASYEGLQRRAKEIPPEFKTHPAEALERLVQCYEAWGKPEQASEWRAKQKAVGKKP